MIIFGEKGLATAAKKAGRIATDGLVSSYIHAGGKIGVLVEINCETDFVARTDDFQTFVKNIAMQIAAANPQYIRREEVPPRGSGEGEADLPDSGVGIRKTGKGDR